MNVLLVVPRFNIGGAESYVAALALALKERGYGVAVASWGGRLAKTMEEQGIRHYLIPIRLHAGVASLLLQRVIKKEKIDLLHANSAAAGAAVALACRRTGLPWVMTAHGAFGREPAYRGMEEAGRVICVSRFLRDALSKGTDIRHDRLVTIYNGIDTKRFSPNEEIRTELRSRWGVTEEDFVIGIVSRITSLNGKGHEDLLRILSRYPETARWRLVIVGKGSMLTMMKLKRHVQNVGLADRVIFAGHRMDVPAMLNGIDVLALPSNFETFGLVLTEAMAMEKPVIAYAVGGTPEVIDEGKSGYLIPKRDLRAMADKLAVLCDDRQMAMEMGRTGRLRVQETFSMDRMLDEMISVYHEVVSEHV